MPVPASSAFSIDPSIIESRWRELTAAESTVAVQLLEDAAAIIAARVPTADSRALSGELDALLIERVQAAMVIRVLSNPDGKRQESIDDYSWVRDNAVSAGLLYITSEEVALLLPTRARARSVTLQTHPTPT